MIKTKRTIQKIKANWNAEPIFNVRCLQQNLELYYYFPKNIRIPQAG